MRKLLACLGHTKDEREIRTFTLTNHIILVQIMSHRMIQWELSFACSNKGLCGSAYLVNDNYIFELKKQDTYENTRSNFPLRNKNGSTLSRIEGMINTTRTSGELF